MAKHLGIQPVLLSRWAPTSVSNLTAVLMSYTGGPLEVGFMPFFHRDGCSAGAGSTPWTNAQAIITALGASVPLRLVVHLSFHRDDHGDDATLARRAARACEEFILLNPTVKFSVTPMLEDEWMDDKTFLHKLSVVAGAIPWSRVKQAGIRLKLRRSSNTKPKVTPPATDLVVKDKSVKPPAKVVIFGRRHPIESEVHGPTHLAGKAEVYSNDGNYVYFDNPNGLALDYVETADSAINAGGDAKNPGKYSLTTFKTTGYGTALLLYRPAYNLYARTFPRNPNVRGKWVYYDPKTGDPNGRLDPGANQDGGYAFDAYEAAVLRAFLNIPEPITANAMANRRGLAPQGTVVMP